MVAWSLSGDDGGAGKGSNLGGKWPSAQPRNRREGGRAAHSHTSHSHSAIAKVTGAKAAPSVVTLTFVLAW